MITLSRYEPFVILLDLDHTIQGNIQPQLEEYNFIEFINNNFMNDKKTKLRQNKDLLHRDFMKGLLRPHFKTFLTRMKSRFPNVEFFVYTASEDKWANYIVRIIENVIKTRLNKRIFSRSDCVVDGRDGHLMISINKLKPELFKILKNKYKLKKDFEFKHVYLIDNNYVLKETESNHLIKCPDYTATVNIDTLRSIPLEIIKDNLEKISLFLLGHPEKSLNMLYKKIHLRTLNSKVVKDSYWETQLKIFKRNYQLS